ncbi:hypothetical protein ILUMI_04131 [Ignelater luminosus]|uniref:REKLES domain-containing protein n=1 Tax=Ignelater luminosus TaxID=2038154 RepID=A0A8K0GEU8_IGNLU|nr:hypothetical protein ILUMI_04131 [Ignelater luminosus]
MKYLYPYECEKRRLSTPAELQAAIDGNRREGRRSSYGQYDNIQRSPIPSSQMSPLSLVSQHQQLTARMNSALTGGIGLHNGAHHPSHPQPMGQPFNGGPIPSLAPSELEARMMEYMKLINKDMRNAAATPPRPGESSPPSATSPLNALEVSRMAIWSLYNNNQIQHEPQKEALNLSETSPHSLPITSNNTNSNQQPVAKREPERECSPPAKKFVKDDDDSKHVITSTLIKVSSRGDPRNGDNSLVVTMELNGILYQGVLFAQSPPSSGRTALTSS